MGTIWYLYKITLKNGFKKAVKRPITYLYAVLILIYGVMLPFSMDVLLSEFSLNTPQGMAGVFSLVVFWLVPANLISYAKRKGLVFKKGDVHFLFPSPVSPKQVLLYAHMKTLGMYVLMSLVILGCGIILFHVPAWQLILYFLVSMGVENVLEASVMLLLYGSEKIGDRGRKAVVAVCYGLMGMFVVIAGVMCLRDGLSLETALAFLHSDEVQLVPVVGWYIGLVHLIFMGPTTVNIIVSACYLLFTLTVLILAVKMPCSGAYYEDAMKFAEDYEELRRKKMEGQTARLGHKEKYGKASIIYKGGGAKAIFYKQQLEYKKSKFYFFDSTTVILIAVGIFIAYTFSSKPGMEDVKAFIVPGVMSYLVFCMSAVSGKWGKELQSPYTFLIPDSSFKKLWYATLMEHVKSFVCGALLAVPCGILLKMPMLQIILSILFYVCLCACKLYNVVMVEALAGSSLGRVGKQLFQMMLQGIVIGLAFTVAALGVVYISMEVGYMLMILILAVTTLGLMTVAAGCFDRMESAE